MEEADERTPFLGANATVARVTMHLDDDNLPVGGLSAEERAAVAIQRSFRKYKEQKKSKYTLRAHAARQFMLAGGPGSKVQEQMTALATKQRLGTASKGIIPFMQRRYDAVRLISEQRLTELQETVKRDRRVKAAIKKVEALLKPLLTWWKEKGNRLTNSADVRVRAMLLASILSGSVLVFGIVYKIVTGAAWSTSLFTTYSILFNAPGTSVTDEPTLIGTLVANTIFIVGIMVFAVFLGMIGEEVNNKIMELRSGTGPLRLNQHILILNYNKNLVPVLRQIAVAASCPNHPYHNRTIVVLADVDKEVMEEDVQQVTLNLTKQRKKHAFVEVHTRSGKPYIVSDLQLVCASKASYVIMLYPDSRTAPLGKAMHASEFAKAEAMKSVTVAAMSTLGNFTDQQMVVQVPNEVPPQHQQLQAVQELLATEGMEVQVVRISEAKVIDRIVAQTALQPGVVSALAQTIRSGKDTSYIWINVTAEDGGGGTYGQLRQRYCNCVVIGYLSAAGVGSEEMPNSPVHLNPKDCAEVVVGDQLVALAKGNPVNNIGGKCSPEAQRMYAKASARALQRIGSMSHHDLPGRRVLVVGWPVEHMNDLVEGFRAFAAKGTHVTFVTSHLPDKLPEGVERVTVEYIQMKVTMSLDNFIRGGMETADSVVLGTPTNMDYPDCDAMVLSGLFQVQAIAGRMQRHVHVVAKAMKSNTKKIAAKFLAELSLKFVSMEFIVPDQISSAILTQVLWQPKIFHIINELMVVGDGAELYILDLDQLGFRKGEFVEFAEVVAAGRLLDMSVLGLSQKNGLALKLAPSSDYVIQFSEGDKIVVVADMVVDI